MIELSFKRSKTWPLVQCSVLSKGFNSYLVIVEEKRFMFILDHLYSTDLFVCMWTKSEQYYLLSFFSIWTHWSCLLVIVFSDTSVLIQWAFVSCLLYPSAQSATSTLTHFPILSLFLLLLQLIFIPLSHFHFSLVLNRCDIEERGCEHTLLKEQL